MALPELPNWETTPDDVAGAIRQVKAALRTRIDASGRTVEEVFAVMERRVLAEVEDIVATRARGEEVWPVVRYTDIANDTVDPATLELLQRRGCLIVRGHFERDQALAWDADIVDYVESNRFFETYRGPGDDFFGSVGSKPEIYPIYWSPPRCKPVRASEWPGCNSSSISVGPMKNPASNPVFVGSTPTAIRCIPTAFVEDPKVPIPPCSEPTSMPALSTCG